MTGAPGESGTKPAGKPDPAASETALPDAPGSGLHDQEEPDVTAEPGTTAGGSVGHFDPAERPEADVLDQAAVVEVDQSIERGAWHDDVAEADWLDQSIEEPLDDERR
ncbi:MAG: hypothetical protein M0020_05990 [Actinomycetota bacterium]|nr:hypothetical protein [Actinomycetota bacterium]